MSEKIYLSEGVAKAIDLEMQKENKDSFDIKTLFNIIENQQKKLENSIPKSNLINLIQEIEDEKKYLLIKSKFKYYNNGRKIKLKTNIIKTREFLKKLKKVLEEE